MIIVGQASALEETHAFGRMADLVPAFLQRGLGSQSMLLVTFKGTVAFGYFHPVVGVLVSVLAIYFATEPAHEVESGLVDLMLARAVPRHVVVTRSLLLAATAVIAAVLLMALGTRVGLRLFASPEFDAPSGATSARLLAHLAAVASCFGGLRRSPSPPAHGDGARRSSRQRSLRSFSTWWTSWRSAGGPMRAVAWLSPFHYYPALSILTGTAPEWRNLGILMAATAVLCAIGYWRFNRRDL